MHHKPMLLSHQPYCWHKGQIPNSLFIVWQLHTYFLLPLRSFLQPDRFFYKENWSISFLCLKHFRNYPFLLHSIHAHSIEAFGALCDLTHHSLAPSVCPPSATGPSHSQAHLFQDSTGWFPFADVTLLLAFPTALLWNEYKLPATSSWRSLITFWNYIIDLHMC